MSCSTVARIIEHKRKDSSTAYLAQIAIKRKGKWAHRESRSFDPSSNTTSQTWIAATSKVTTSSTLPKNCHDEEEVMAISDRVAVVIGGQIAQTGGQGTSHIRPEDIWLNADTQDFSVPVTVSSIKPLGGYTIVNVTLGTRS